tara:strand:+ start:552 stop:839 length:288 start_codon:yes stop_codon:yes gene_type:complete
MNAQEKYELLRSTLGVDRIATGYQVVNGNVVNKGGTEPSFSLRGSGDLVRVCDSEVIAHVNSSLKMLLIDGSQTGFYLSGVSIYYNSGWDSFKGQ